MDAGDFALEKTFDVKFTTINSSGVPTALLGTPVVAAYPGNSTTEVTAGITLTVDFDARTGLNNVRVVATAANGYLTATNYTLVLTAGTVDGTSVVGYVVGHFSIENRSALRPATADRTLVVSAGGVANADAVAFSGDTVAADNAEAFFDGTGYAGTNNVIPTVTTLTGHTAQTGDSFAIVNSGVHGNAAIKGFVDDIGVAGAGLTAVPWNAVWDAEVQSEVEDAIVVHRLDELLNADSDIDGAAPPTVGSVFHELMTKTAGSFTYDQTTDSLEALRDRGDAAWTTATGFSTHSAADVWAVATRVLTAGTNLSFSTHSAADVWAAGTRTLTTIAAATLAGATADKIADHVRRRTQANVEASSDGDAVSLGSEYGMIQQAQESSASGGTLTVFKTDGSTSLGTKTLTTDAAADPITAIA